MFKVGDRIVVEMKCRGKGRVGGWKSEYRLGWVNRVGRVNIRVELDEFYFGHFHWMKPDRLKSAEEDQPESIQVE